MERYKSVHLLMLVPFLLMQAGIFFDYWGDFTKNAWAIHVHYWLATAWYVFLVVQPWLYNRGEIATHRTLGIIGIFIAGGLGWGALAMMHRDLMLVELSTQHADRFGPFKPWFFYGIAVVEIILVSAFLLAVLQAILHRKRLEDHAWWLITTVFILMMPALARGFQAVWFLTQGFTPETSVMIPLHAAAGVIIALIVAGALWLKKLSHPATWIAVGANCFSFLLEPLGKSHAVQQTLTALIKG